jgi:hypothetical protein
VEAGFSQEVQPIHHRMNRQKNQREQWTPVLFAGGSTDESDEYAVETGFFVTGITGVANSRRPFCFVPVLLPRDKQRDRGAMMVVHRILSLQLGHPAEKK